jgi:predicted nucleic acid-binding protein
VTDALVDTSVVIDLLRNYAPAVEWLQTQPALSIPRVVVLEVIDGAQNKRNLAASLKMLDRFTIVPMTDDDVVWAVEQMALVRLSYQIDPMVPQLASTPY